MATVAQTPIKCELCTSDIDVNFFCVKCGQTICVNCKRIHSKITTTKNHEIISLSDARVQKKMKRAVVMCNDHSTEELSMFCKHCDEFICTECTDKHEGHKLTTLKKIIQTQKEELAASMKELQNKKDILKRALDTENNIYTQNTTCYDETRTEISNHVSKIIKEVTNLRDELFSELSSLQRKENQRHSDAQTGIQSQTQAVMSAIEMVQTAADSVDPFTVTGSRKTASNLVQNFHVPCQPKKVRTVFQPGDIDRRDLLPLFGDMVIKADDARPVHLYQTKSDRGQLRSDSAAEHTDVNKVKIVSTIRVKGTTNKISVIVPVQDKLAWVAASGSTQLTKINTDGVIIKKSIKLCDDGSNIVDAKLFHSDILVTIWQNHRVIRLSDDGERVTTFADLSPNYPLGLCATDKQGVLLCLKSTRKQNVTNTKVVRLNSRGDVIQIIQSDDKGSSLHSWPYGVTSLQSGEVIVTDRDEHMRVLCVNSDGHQIFQWKGEVEGMKDNRLDPMKITNDEYGNLFITDSNNHRVYVLNKDGTNTKVLLDHTVGMQHPYGLAVDSDGHLLVGCDEGTVHVIKY